MSDPTTDWPIQPTPDGYTEVEGEAFEFPAATGWVIHTVEGKPQQTSTRTLWAWCKVSTEGPGYTDIVFTETDGATHVDPYPVRYDDNTGVPLDQPHPVQLGPVVFKVFC